MQDGFFCSGTFPDRFRTNKENTLHGSRIYDLMMNSRPIEEREHLERVESEKNVTRAKRLVLKPKQAAIYKVTLATLNAAHIQYAVGAAFARYAYTSIWRYTKDLDIFIKPENLRASMEALTKAGFETRIKEEHWLAKAWMDEYFIDLIFGTGHGQIPVDDETFRGSKRTRILGITTSLLPVEEMIASSMYIASRNRFDGPEIVHLIHSYKGKLDWERILHRLGENRELLLWYLLLFDFIYPGHPSYLPKDIMVELFSEVQKRWRRHHLDPADFRGTLLDPFSYNVDIADWGYEDQRDQSPLVNGKGEAL